MNESKIKMLQEVKRIRKEHAWIVNPIYNAVDYVQNTPFFEWIKNAESVEAFKPILTQLYYHSVSFPKVVGLMLAHTSLEDSYMLPYYSEHAVEEADHHLMLRQWMVKHGLLKTEKEILDYLPNASTNACVNIAYQIAMEGDHEKWIVSINCGIELCSNELFKILAPKMRELGVGDKYFDIHVEADEFHSVLGLEHIGKYSPNSVRGRLLITKALEAISLWSAMLNSWIGVFDQPCFDIEGNIINRQSLAA